MILQISLLILLNEGDDNEDSGGGGKKMTVTYSKTMSNSYGLAAHFDPSRLSGICGTVQCLRAANAMARAKIKVPNEGMLMGGTFQVHSGIRNPGIRKLNQTIHLLVFMYTYKSISIGLRDLSTKIH